VVLFLERGECRGEIRGFPGGKLEGDRRGGISMGAYVSSPASWRRACSFSSPSIPSRNWSSDREMWPSCESRERLSVFARCRSRRDSLMWSARRRSAFGFDMVTGCCLLDRERAGPERDDVEERGDEMQRADGLASNHAVFRLAVGVN